MKQLACLLGVIQIPIVSLEFEGPQQAGRYTILLTTERKLPPPKKISQTKLTKPKKLYQKPPRIFLIKKKLDTQRSQLSAKADKLLPL